MGFWPLNLPLRSQTSHHQSKWHRQGAEHQHRMMECPISWLACHENARLLTTNDYHQRWLCSSESSLLVSSSYDLYLNGPHPAGRHLYPVWYRPICLRLHMQGHIIYRCDLAYPSLLSLVFRFFCVPFHHSCHMDRANRTTNAHRRSHQLCTWLSTCVLFALSTYGHCSLTWFKLYYPYPLL